MGRRSSKSISGLLLLVIAGLAIAGAVWCCLSEIAGRPGASSSSPLESNPATNPSNGAETVEVTLAVSGMT